MSTVGTFVTGHSVLRYGQNLHTSQQGQPHTIQIVRAHARDLTMAAAGINTIIKNVEMDLAVMHTHAFIREPNKPCLCLPSRNWSSFYRPWRDGKLSWPSWLITYLDGLPVRWRSPIQILTGSDVDYLAESTNVLTDYVKPSTLYFVCVQWSCTATHRRRPRHNFCFTLRITTWPTEISLSLRSTGDADPSTINRHRMHSTNLWMTPMICPDVDVFSPSLNRWSNLLIIEIYVGLYIACVLYDMYIAKSLAIW